LCINNVANVVIFTLSSMYFINEGWSRPPSCFRIPASWDRSKFFRAFKLFLACSLRVIFHTSLLFLSYFYLACDAFGYRVHSRHLLERPTPPPFISAGASSPTFTFPCTMPLLWNSKTFWPCNTPSLYIRGLVTLHVFFFFFVENLTPQFFEAVSPPPGTSLTCHRAFTKKLFLASVGGSLASPLVQFPIPKRIYERVSGISTPPTLVGFFLLRLFFWLLNQRGSPENLLLISSC